ncbi:hypothetical protein CBM2637_B10123 [Cupriavidus taiwanensis]|nr:hypothetical protein CBM2637_B10123 [Cupriavidus taiwanensis]
MPIILCAMTQAAQAREHGFIHMLQSAGIRPAGVAQSAGWGLPAAAHHHLAFAGHVSYAAAQEL